MTPSRDTPHKSTRRSRRPPRKSVVCTSSQMLSAHSAEVSTDTGTETPSVQPTRILHRGDPDAFTSTAPIVHTAPSPPRTPPRPKSMYAGSAEKQQPGNVSLDSPQNTRKTPRTQCRKKSGQASPVPGINGTSILTPRRDSTTPRRDSSTPNGTTETPSKAYAGPTFHASPAASSLPMPKFYSKSVPNVDKSKTLKTMMEQDAPESSSGSEASPTFEIAQPSTSARVQEESPLDIFFRADREAKGRNGSAPDMSTSRDRQVSGFNPPSRLMAPNRHRSCDNSVGGMFAMEMDGMAPEVSSGPGVPGKAPVISKTAANSPGLTEAEREEQRRAQTVALKKLLHSPRPQIFHNNSTGQRPPSSKLRTEMSMPTSPEHADTPELPATPTPSRVIHPRTPPQNHEKQQNFMSPYTPFNSVTKPGAGHNAPFPHDASKSKSIEDDLRRILNMDALGNNGVTELRS